MVRKLFDFSFVLSGRPRSRVSRERAQIRQGRFKGAVFAADTHCFLMFFSPLRQTLPSFLFSLYSLFFVISLKRSSLSVPSYFGLGESPNCNSFVLPPPVSEGNAEGRLSLTGLVCRAVVCLTSLYRPDIFFAAQEFVHSLNRSTSDMHRLKIGFAFSLPAFVSSPFSSGAFNGQGLD